MNDRILRALRREPVDRTPIWFMRQAGRALPRYREARADYGMFEILRDPQRAAEITMMPLDYFPVDAAVLYNDLSTPYFGAGFDVEMKPGIGPVVHNPIVDGRDVARMTPFDPRTTLDFNLEQIRILVERIDVPVLGFVGAPFTLSSYLIKGQRSKDFAEVKAFMWRDPAAWHALAEFWAEHNAEFGIAQHEAGAGAVQVFDSWAGTLGPDDYARYVLPYMKTLIGRMEAAGVPVINFYNGNPALLPLVTEAGGAAVSIDWRQPIDEAWRIIGSERAVQGNMDPAILLAGEGPSLDRARDVLDRVGNRAGHIFNLGHGILPGTDHQVLRAVVDFVHEYSAR
ncbi:MAG: uroporphyrinogen decarboxylase [Longimicrobiales bacterium]